ncbi:hypothetical protein Taro_034551 [Colocasia esculenta]|uniref:Ubiquinone biosynthesis protein n=1 Tax=Colocasia esculenta TaxID=4460 RepID=A0A843VRR0_COLES|nr:hypothetical protein [Colocasia esculenta]
MLRAATAARRLLPPGTVRLRHFPRASFSTAAPPPAEPPQRSPFQPPPPPPPPVAQPQQQGSTTAAPEPEPSYESASTTAAAAGAEAAAAAEDLRRKRRSRAKGGDYDDGQAPVLKAALGHVRKLGWSESALIAGARDVGLSPSIVASFPRKEAALVEFFMDDCLEKLIDRVDSDELDLSNLILSERLSKLIRIRLEMQIPYISKWAQALSIQAQPMNIPTCFKQRIMLVDEIWHASGDETSDIDWYVKRTILSGIYSASEVYMLTDNSPGWFLHSECCDTWTFLDNRIKDAFDIQKTAQEAAYIAEAVGTGVGNSMQDFMKRLFKGFKV